ncbi:TetR/AcrR family transcriptional regulator [Salipiger bermudensis]|uniref:TetR/AcrR family transcriptional regulator n=1 Tax=Salipiger bermudensis TaxID=344736 RepID=UPI001C99CAA8|nr:TetR/AcrR family transcriptional regulator [Salipiger bermudensis]MBY6003829.1 TetR/AcrR family transcriptional regulator [Salipiger bermudensis]
MPGNAASVRRGRKYDQVLNGAREIFLRDGFEGASVDEIARTAGVSKATLYSYFPDKRLLFMEMATAQCQAQADAVLLALDPSQPPRIVLRYIGHSVLGFLLSEMGLRVFRICVAEADRFPELGAQFYECGPVLVRNELKSYLATAMARGEVEIDDLGLAADQFIELCKADLWIKRLFGIRDDFSEDEIAHVVDAAVETFLARCGPSN